MNYTESNVKIEGKRKEFLKKEQEKKSNNVFCLGQSTAIKRYRKLGDRAAVLSFSVPVPSLQYVTTISTKKKKLILHNLTEYQGMISFLLAEKKNT